MVKTALDRSRLRLISVKWIALRRDTRTTSSGVTLQKWRLAPSFEADCRLCHGRPGPGSGIPNQEPTRPDWRSCRPAPVDLELSRSAYLVMPAGFVRGLRDR